MKTCCACKASKPFDDFYKNKVMGDGYHSHCKECHKIAGKARKKLVRQDPEFRAKELAYKKEYRARTVEQRKAYMQEWRLKNAQWQVEYRKQYKVANPEYFKIYSQVNKHKLIAKARRYQATKLQRTPAWLTPTDLWMIEEAYELAALRTKVFGFAWHVDHKIPLQGKLVSGLHTPYNLQVIPALDNWAKNNRFEI